LSSSLSSYLLKYSDLLMVIAVHEARLSLVRINILFKPILRPCWSPVLHYKCTEDSVQFSTTGPSATSLDKNPVACSILIGNSKTSVNEQ
jgi:hypothetical protein